MYVINRKELHFVNYCTGGLIIGNILFLCWFADEYVTTSLLTFVNPVHVFSEKVHLIKIPP